MKELGEYLKHTRISNGVSIAEAAEDLDFSPSHIENIESGNVKAFKDVYELKESVKQYAKYLGLKPDDVINEFNDFLFEHTSKISLDDIKAAQKKNTSNEKKVKSPYTKEYKEKIKVWPICLIVLILVILIFIIYIVVKNNNKVPIRVDELVPYRGVEVNEFTK